MTKTQNNQIVIKEKEKIMWDYMHYFNSACWLDKISNQNIIKYVFSVSIMISSIIDWLIKEEENDIVTINDAIYSLKIIKQNINNPETIKNITDWLPEKIYHIRDNIKARTIKKLIPSPEHAA